MASFSDKIRILLDVDSDGAVSQLKGFRQSVSDAHGVTGKFRAGASSAFESVKQNAGALALGAGAALATFAIKAVGAFTDTAKAAIDLGAATGLATEDASRWIAVADDFEVSAEQLQSGIGKIAKSLDDSKWAKYGIETRDAAGNARNANDILLDSLAALSSVQNATERARIGTELFGKGYSNLAPLVGKTRAEYEKMLGSVEKGQVITDKEARKAEDMRLAQDALADAIKEVTLAVGGLVAGLAPYVTKLVTVISYLEKIPHLQQLAFGGLQADAGSAADSLMKLAAEAAASGDAIQYLVDQGRTVKFATQLMKDYEGQQTKVAEATKDTTDASEDQTAALEDNARLVGEWTSEAIKMIVKRKEDIEAAQAQRAEQDRLSDAQQRGIDKMREFKSSLTDMLRADDLEAGFLNLMQSFDDVTQKIFDLQLAANNGEISMVENMRGQRLAVLGLKEEVETVAEKYGLFDRDVEAVLTLVDNGSFDAAEQRLAILTRNRTMEISIIERGGDGYGTGGRDGRRAIGGPVAAGGSYIVGEHGPEVLQMGGTGGNVVPNNALGGMGGGIVVNNYSADPNQVIELLKKYTRKNGRAWLDNL